MPCEFCPHCKEKEQVEAALAARMTQDSFDEFPMAQPGPAPPALVVPTLNDHQKEIAFDICNNSEITKLHYIEGVSGTGKTYTLNTMYALFKNMGVSVEVISTGPFPTTNVAKNILKFLALSDEAIEELDVILIDNGNQLTESHMKSLCEKLKRVMGNDVNFGGKIVVLAADFGQLLPYSNGNQKIKESLKHLTVNTVAPFKKHSLPPGNNDWNVFLESARKSPIVTIPERNMVRTLEELIEFTYGPLQAEYPHTTGIILSPKKMDVEVANRRVLEKMRGRVQVFEAQFNAKVIRSDLDLHELRLKKNCILVLDEPAEGLPKGTRLVFEDSTRSHLCCRVLHSVQMVDLERTKRYLAPTASPVKRQGSNANNGQQSVKQFPVSLDFARTIHGAQGHHFDKVGLYKIDQSFDHGMIYTAVSRSKGMEGLKIVTDSNKIKNIVEASLI